MKLQNNSKATLIHDEVRLLPGEIIELGKKQEHIAKIFLCYEGVVEYADPKEVKAKEEKLKAENAELKAKIAELEKEVKAKEEKTKSAKK